MLQDQLKNELPGEAGEQALTFWERTAFSPSIDIPLTIACVVGTVLYFRRWAKANDPETNFDLHARLPKACVRATIFFLVMLLFFYFTNIAVWLPFVCTVLITGGFAGDLFGGITLAAITLREFCFGFPTLIHDGPRESVDERQSKSEELIGLLGTTTSPLRPSGYISINDEEHSAVSDTGEMIQAGSKVIVTKIRNGQACVRLNDS